MSEKSQKNTFNTRTALVYTGAALLIAIVGVRTLLSVADEWGTMEYITMGAIFIEFGVLLLYAYTIYAESPEEKPAATDSVTLTPDPSFVNALTEAQEASNNQIRKDIKSALGLIRKRVDRMGSQLTRLNHSTDKIADFANGRFERMARESVQETASQVTPILELTREVAEQLRESQKFLAEAFAHLHNLAEPPRFESNGKGHLAEELAGE